MIRYGVRTRSPNGGGGRLVGWEVLDGGYSPRVRMGERLDRFWCWCLGHRWVSRTFHDTQGAHDFVVCTRCGKVSGPDGEARGFLGRWT